MKNEIISEITAKLAALGIPMQRGQDTDIVIDTVFLDAGWSTGTKKIGYEASIFINEQDRVVYMYEKTVETGSGLSFGSESGSAFQSGKTLFRKVKSIQYGPDGKAYEYVIDLGAITKAVKETAKRYGWKFKTVLTKSKAKYHATYVPEFAPAFIPAFAPASAPQPVKKSTRADSGILGLIGFLLLGVSLIIALAAIKAAPVIWAVGIVMLIVAFVIQRILSKKGCLMNLLLWGITGIALLAVLVVADVPSSNKASSSQLSMVLPYEKSFTLNDGKSVGKIMLFVSDGTGEYANYKGAVICRFHVKFDTSSLPADFKMRADQATANNAMGYPALDGLIMAVCSDTGAYHKSSLGSGEYIYSNNNKRPFVETTAETTSVNADWLIDFSKKYPKMQILRYNQNEVGMTNSGEYWTTHSEKAFGLHPPVTEGMIPWGEILSDLGLDQ